MLLFFKLIGKTCEILVKDNTEFGEFNGRNEQSQDNNKNMIT